MSVEAEGVDADGIRLVRFDLPLSDDDEEVVAMADPTTEQMIAQVQQSNDAELLQAKERVYQKSRSAYCTLLLVLFVMLFLVLLLWQLVLAYIHDPWVLQQQSSSSSTGHSSSTASDNVVDMDLAFQNPSPRVDRNRIRRAVLVGR